MVGHLWRSFSTAPEANLGKRKQVRTALCKMASVAFNEAPARRQPPDQLNECRRTLCGSRLRCFFRDRIISVNLDGIAGVRTTIDEKPHIGLAVCNEFDVSLTIRDGQNRNQNWVLRSYFGSVVAISGSRSPASDLMSLVTIASSSG